MDSLLIALEYCVKQYNVAPSYSSVLKMLIGFEDADRLQKGIHMHRWPYKKEPTYFCP